LTFRFNEINLERKLTKSGTRAMLCYVTYVVREHKLSL